MKKLHEMIPELLEGEDFGDGQLPEIPVMIMSEQMHKVRLRT